MQPVVSIIMPVFNAEGYISAAIDSVVDQSFSDFELLIINDGSTDLTEQLIKRNEDHRIIYFKQENRGVSSARNVGLSHMKGDYFCFVDADDILPLNSLEARLRVFENNPSLTFADGSVAFMNEKLERIIRLYKPSFTGNPLRGLLQLKDTCFSSLSWMIKRTEDNAQLHMNEKITHGEDLLYYMELARMGGLYGYTNEVVLTYRQHQHSAMRNLEALENGYWQIFDGIKDWEAFTPEIRRTYRYKVKKFMMLDYLKRGNFGNAFSTLIK
jgi:teichuronic acid biosynthesis glycosyltransferase TuaG